MKIVMTGYFPDAAGRRIRESFPGEWELAIVSPEDVYGELSTADVLSPEHLRVDAALLEKAPRLKLVQTGAGYDNVNIADCTECGVQVCNAAGVNAAAVAEHVMAFLLCYYKNLIGLDRFMKAQGREPMPEYSGAELSRKTIGIIGLGNVGRKVAEYSRAFGMRVLGCGRNGAALPGAESRSLKELCRESDIVSIHVPLTAETRHMINAEVFSIMKKDALLINTSRGAVIEEAQLIRALQDGQIGGACLDVYENEPLSAGSPLRELNNVILTPHTAGYPDGVLFHEKRCEFFVGNIRRVLLGELPECRLNTV